MRCYAQKRTTCPSTPLCSQMGWKTLKSSAEPAHLRREMTRAEQVSQPRPNNILCPLHFSTRASAEATAVRSRNYYYQPPNAARQGPHSLLTEGVTTHEVPVFGPSFPLVLFTSRNVSLLQPLPNVMRLKLQTHLPLAFKQVQVQSSCVYD